MAITKRHHVQSQSETYEEKVLFKPDLSATSSHRRPPVTVLRPVVPEETSAHRHCADVLADFSDSVDQFYGSAPGGAGAAGRRQAALQKIAT